MFKKIKYNSKYLIKDESDSEDNNVDWSIDSDEKNKTNEKEKEKEKENFDDEINSDEINEIMESSESKIENPEINIEIVEDNKKKKSVKVSINLEMKKDNKNDIISIDFIINRETFLKIAKELK
jgi:hypothetical protein